MIPSPLHCTMLGTNLYQQSPESQSGVARAIYNVIIVVIGERYRTLKIGVLCANCKILTRYLNHVVVFGCLC